MQDMHVQDAPRRAPGAEGQAAKEMAKQHQLRKAADKKRQQQEASAARKKPREDARHKAAKPSSRTAAVEEAAAAAAAEEEAQQQQRRLPRVGLRKDHTSQRGRRVVPTRSLSGEEWA